MTTSTPPAWNFHHECDVPVTMEELSIHTHKPPDSDAFRERNGSDTCHICLLRITGTVFMRDGKAYCGGCAQLYDPDVSFATTKKLEPDPTYRGCQPSERYLSDGPDSTGKGGWTLPRAVSTTASGACCVDQCPECRCAPDKPHATGCESTAKVTDAQSNAVKTHPAWCDVSSGPVISCDRKHDNRHDGEPLLRVTEPETALLKATAPEATARADSCVESCPECGTVTDIEYPAKMAGKVADTFDVPFSVQEFMFESQAERSIAWLHGLIDDHHTRIIEMARDRFRKEFCKFGSAMYSWSPERRLDETLQEIADAVVYPTSGPIE